MVNDQCENPKLSVGNGTPFLVVLCCVKITILLKREDQVSEQHPSMVLFQLLTLGSSLIPALASLGDGL